MWHIILLDDADEMAGFYINDDNFDAVAEKYMIEDYAKDGYVDYWLLDVNYDYIYSNTDLEFEGEPDDPKNVHVLASGDVLNAEVDWREGDTSDEEWTRRVEEWKANHSYNIFYGHVAPDCYTECGIED